MSRSGEWGGEPELLMLSKYLKRPIEARMGRGFFIFIFLIIFFRGVLSYIGKPVFFFQKIDSFK